MSEKQKVLAEAFFEAAAHGHCEQISLRARRAGRRARCARRREFCLSSNAELSPSRESSSRAGDWVA
jgi:hypothetical protein